MRVLITGGGTGGHIYPALAIAKGIKKRFPQAEMLFVGGSRGLEAEIVPQEGFEFRAINVEGLPRKLYRVRKLVKALWKTCRGSCEAYKILKEFKPTVVVGTGGYVCFSLVMMASVLRIPTLIQEQNALPGRANKILAHFATKVAVTFADSAKYFTSKADIVLTGLPVRPEIIAADRKMAISALGLKPDKFTILAMGGSQGSQKINAAMCEFISHICADSRYQVIHITGPSGYDKVVTELEKRGIDLGKCGNISIRPYIYNMSEVLAASDFVICRAGATTIAEISVRGLPAVLVPYPYAANNHQEYNALAMVEKGAAIKIADKDLTGELIWKEFSKIVMNREALLHMSAMAKKLGKPDALDRLVDLIQRINKA